MSESNIVSFVVDSQTMLDGWTAIPYHSRKGSKTVSIATTLRTLEQYRDNEREEFPGLNSQQTEQVRSALTGEEGEYDLFALGEVIGLLEQLDGFGKAHTDRLAQTGQQVVQIVEALGEG